MPTCCMPYHLGMEENQKQNETCGFRNLGLKHIFLCYLSADNHYVKITVISNFSVEAFQIL